MEFSQVSPLRIALLDDHAMIRYGQATRFAQESDFLIVGEYSSSRGLLEGLRTVKVDVLVLDYSLRPDELDGLNLIRLLRRRYPQMRIVISSAHEHSATVQLIIRAGVQGFVGKTQDIEKLIDAVRVVAAERMYLDPLMTAEFDPAFKIEATDDGQGDVLGLEGEDSVLVRSASLSIREREVLRCCLDGMSVTQIASKFSRSIKTISGQKQAAFRKLGVKNDTEMFKLHAHLGGF